MCEFFSCIATRDGRILFNEYDAHQSTVHDAGLDDTKLKDRDFVRLEVIPKDTDGSRWIYHIDERGTLPTWYGNNSRSITRKARWLAWEVFLARKRHSMPVMVSDIVDWDFTDFRSDGAWEKYVEEISAMEGYVSPTWFKERLIMGY